MKPGEIVALISVCVTVGFMASTALAKLGRWGGSKETVLETLKHTLDEFKQEIRADFVDLKAEFGKLRDKVGVMGETLSAHNEFILLLKQERGSRDGR